MHARLHYCTIRLAASEFAIEVADIQEVLRDCEWTPVPRAPCSVLGLMNLRGEIVTVLDLATSLGLASPADASRRKFTIILSGSRPPLGLAVDDVGEILSIAAEELLGAPATLEPGARAKVRGVRLVEDRLITVLETRALFDGDPREVAGGV